MRGGARDVELEGTPEDAAMARGPDGKISAMDGIFDRLALQR